MASAIALRSAFARVIKPQRARLGRALSSAAGGGAPPAGTNADHAGSAAVIGACYIGAALWLYNDYLEKPKPTKQSAEALAAASTAHGVEAIAADVATLREQIEAMDETSRWLAGGCRTGPLVVVGTGGGADSLYTFRVSPARTAALPVGEPLKVGLNPAFVSAAKGKGVLYVAHEGAVSAVAVDPRAATLSPRGHAQDANGAGTAYVECDGPKCRHVLAANYAGGSVCVLPVLPDGSLGPATDAKHHAAAAGALKPHLADRQEAAHPHSIRVDPWQGAWALVPDLGLDTLFVYAYDAAKGILAGAQTADRHWKAMEGAGPRHLCFSPPSRATHLIYSLHEMSGTVSVLEQHRTTGQLTERQTVSLLPPHVAPTRQGHCGSAEIAMHPSGKFLYASNRQNHSISILTVDEATGNLSLFANVPCGGKTPRHFQISAAGDFLVVANQSSNDIALFKIDQKSGMLSKPAVTAVPASPRCICIVDDADRPLDLK